MSWKYAATFASTVPSSNYSVPSYLAHNNNNNNNMDPFGGPPSIRPANGSEQHLKALSDALIPNWTSGEFTRFVDACRAIVDELANAETTGEGHGHLVRCESQYQQVLFLWEKLWPEVDGMGQEPDPQDDGTADDTPEPAATHSNGIAAPTNGNASGGEKANAIELGDDDEDNTENREEDATMDQADSPYGGTGLGAIAAAIKAA